MIHRLLIMIVLAAAGLAGVVAAADCFSRQKLEARPYNGTLKPYLIGHMALKVPEEMPVKWWRTTLRWPDDTGSFQETLTKPEDAAAEFEKAWQDQKTRLSAESTDLSAEFYQPVILLTFKSGNTTRYQLYIQYDDGYASFSAWGSSTLDENMQGSPEYEQEKRKIFVDRCRDFLFSYHWLGSESAEDVSGYRTRYGIISPSADSPDFEFQIVWERPGKYQMNFHNWKAVSHPASDAELGDPFQPIMALLLGSRGGIALEPRILAGRPGKESAIWMMPLISLRKSRDSIMNYLHVSWNEDSELDLDTGTREFMGLGAYYTPEDMNEAEEVMGIWQGILGSIEGQAP